MAEQDTWQEADLLQLVSEGADESLELDFKESGALQKTDGKKRDLSKDVSAFANSAGGTLVYGIIEDQETHVASALDDGFDPTEISKEWIEQVINSNIQPRISGVRIHAVELVTHNPGNVAYVVTVPRSSTAHQAADKRYYKRYNFESVRMEHYEIIDVLNRAVGSELELQFLIGGITEGVVNFTRRGNTTCSPEIEAWLGNRANAGLAEQCQCQIFLPANLKVRAIANFIGTSGAPVHMPLSFFPSTSYLSEGDMRVPLGYSEVRLGSDLGPTYPEERRRLLTLSFCNQSLDNRREEINLIWRVRAPGASPRAGGITFRFSTGDWYFKPVTIEAMGEAGLAVRLAQ